MELVYCPNGHPNRPGTRICAVCRALVEQRASSFPATSEQPPRRPSAPRPVETIADTEVEPAPVAAAPQKENRRWLWAALLLLLLGVLALGIFLALIYPSARPSQGQPTPRLESTVAVVIEPTALPLPTTPPEPTPTADIPPSVADIATDTPPTAVSTITPLSTIVGIVITPTFSFGPDTNFLQNGDFASDWANGWSSEMSGESNRIEIRPMQDEPDVMTLHLEKTGPGYLKLAQRIVLTYPIEGLEFQARIQATGTATAAEGRGALILQYEDVNGNPLGASVWLDGAAELTDPGAILGATSMPFPSGIPLAARGLDEGWQTLTVDLGREFADELGEVNPVDVGQITVILAVIGEDACDPAGCGTTLDIAQLSLTPNLP